MYINMHVSFNYDKCMACCYTVLLMSLYIYFFYAPRKILGEHIVAALSVHPSIRPIRVRPITLLLEVWFRNNFTEMTTMLRRRVACTFGSLPWWSRSQHDLAAKLCPAHNFNIWSQISKIFHRNDHHIETLCCAQHLGHYIEGQGHSMTLQQNHVRPITLLF